MPLTCVSQDARGLTSTFDDVADEVSQALRQSGYAEFRDLEVEVDGHEVCLRGRVPSFFFRQKAEFLAWSVSAAGILRSEIEVCPVAQTWRG